MIKTEGTKTDWSNDEDDNWDDWGDAEDEITDCDKQSEIEAIETKSTNQEKIPSEKLNCSFEATNSNIKTHHNDAEAGVQPPEHKSWGSVWKPWGGVVSSVFSTASEGLGSITSTVSQGLTNAIGVPDPEDLARLNAAEKQKDEESRTLKKSSETQDKTHGEHHSSAPAFGLNIVSGVTTLGSKVINTGLDTLEGIGKKTMNILQENDPLLVNKRKMLGLETERPNLSEILKEAKQESDQLENTMKELKLEKSKEQLRFDILFENNCGLVHLEALEILSTESEIKLKSLLLAVSGMALEELQETINEVKELMELEDLEGESDGNYDENQLNDNLMAAVEDAEIQINFDDLKKNWADALTFINAHLINNAADCNAVVQETYAEGVSTLAKACALEMNKLHKIAELLLVKEHHSTANEVDSIVQLCKQFTLHLSGVANRFAATLNAQQDDAKPQINALFAEMCQAMQVIEKALKLFLPILQIGAV